MSKKTKLKIGFIFSTVLIVIVVIFSTLTNRLSLVNSAIEEAITYSVSYLSYNDTEQTMTELDVLNSRILPVDNILQSPELPSGCEITSLTIVLNYLGYEVSNETMADDYLETSTSSTTNLYEAFRGNPHDNTGYGCYSPVIVNAANDFLNDVGGDVAAYDISGSSLDELFAQIDEGNPIIIWGSTDINEEITFDHTWLSDGETMVWSSLQHCMVLIGYNLDAGTVYVANPLSGIEEYDMDLFNQRYQEYFSQAVVLY